MFNFFNYFKKCFNNYFYLNHTERKYLRELEAFFKFVCYENKIICLFFAKICSTRFLIIFVNLITDLENFS